MWNAGLAGKICFHFSTFLQLHKHTWLGNVSSFLCVWCVCKSRFNKPCRGNVLCSFLVHLHCCSLCHSNNLLKGYIRRKVDISFSTKSNIHFGNWHGGASSQVHHILCVCAWCQRASHVSLDTRGHAKTSIPDKAGWVSELWRRINLAVAAAAGSYQLLSLFLKIVEVNFFFPVLTALLRRGANMIGK